MPQETPTSSNPDSQRRIVALDIVRIVAIALVILCHSTEMILFKNENISQTIPHILHTMSRVGVPLFFMLTGFLLLSKTYTKEDCKRFYKHNFVSLIICWETWIILYNIFFVAIGRDFIGISNLLKQMFFLANVDLAMAWYMPAIIGIYLLIPFLANALHSIKIEYTLFVSLVVYIVYFVIPTIKYHSVIQDHMYITYLLYIVFGFFLFKLSAIKTSATRLIVLCLIFVVTFGLCLCYQKFTHTQTLWYDNAFLPLIAFLFFGIVLILSKNLKQNICLKCLSGYSFGVYLIHECVLIVLCTVLKDMDSIPLFFLSLIATTIICFFIVFLISFVPHVRKILFRLKN